MAAVGRESRFMPTVKCSTCGLQVEISLMGEHTCTGSPVPDSTPPLPAASLFGRLLPAFGSSTTQKQQPRAPPQVDTTAANRAYMGQGDLTPVSLSSGSQNSISPQTPDVRPGAGKADDYFTPTIANNSPPPAQSRRPGGYGGLEAGYEDSSFPAKPAPSPMNAISPAPLDSGRRPSAAGHGGINDGKTPRTGGGYGGLGSRTDAPPTPSRAETFPRPSESFAPPQRTPSAPPPSATLRPDGPAPMDRPRRPSRGPETPRAPPPRTGLLRPKTPVVPTINLAEEFGIGNPYHTPSESSSSTTSDNSRQLDRRPSQASQVSMASSRTSPPRSLSSRSGRNPSDTSSFDNLMSDIQSSMDDMKAKPPPLKVPSRDPRENRPFSPLSARPPRTGDRGYDPRIDPAIQNPRSARGRSPMPSPMVNTPTEEPSNTLSIQPPPDPPTSAPLPSPGYTTSPERLPLDRQQAQPLFQQKQNFPPRRRPSIDPPRSARPADPRDPSTPATPLSASSTSSRGNCKACHLPIKGKSISSADGRLTGRYHKPCFVCSTCQSPFSSSTFYVLDDKPYCELHYHKLNGSLCGSCGRGIEGQYLEDESRTKHHVGCFKCGECGMALRNGYFEVGGRTVCEGDAWRLVQMQNPQNPQNQGSDGNLGGGGRGGMRPGLGKPGMGMGLPGGPRGFGPGGGPGGYGGGRMGPGMGLGPRPKMEKRMTRLGMM